MRVFRSRVRQLLRSPRPRPSAASNGPDRELSPFRELLTEFRNLTERGTDRHPGPRRVSRRGRIAAVPRSICWRRGSTSACPGRRAPVVAVAHAAAAGQRAIDSAPSGEATVEHEEEAHRRRARARAGRPRASPRPWREPRIRAQRTSRGARPPVLFRSRRTPTVPARDTLPAEPMLVADAEEDASEPAAFAEGV